MGLFSSARARRAKREAAAQSNGNGAAPAAAAPATGRPAPVGGRSLRDSIQHLYTIRPSRDAFAEEVIKIIAKGAGVKAAALLGYEQRGGRVRLLATAGLDREAIQVLSGDATSSPWDIPIRTIRNRRISVIEAAHENPFVPSAIASISPRRLTIAAIPFYHANTPIGVVVLFSPTQRGFADGLLHTISQALKVCALALAELPSSTAVEPSKFVEVQENEQQPNLLRGLAALKNELARLTQALEETERQRAAEAAERVTAQSFLQAAREKHALLEQEASELRQELERLPELESQVQALNERLAEAVARAETEREQVAKLQARLDEIEQLAEGEASAASGLARARDELQERLDVALEAARERNEAAEALEQRVAELSERAARVEKLESSQSAAQQERERLGKQLADLNEQLAASQREIESRRSALGTTAEGLEEARREAQSLAAQLEEARARIDELARFEPALQEARRELDSLADERRRLGEELEQARAALDAAGKQHRSESAGWQARVRELEDEQARLQAQLAHAHGESAEIIAELKSGVESKVRERVDLLQRIHELEEVEADRERLRARFEDAEGELLAAQEAKTELEARIDELGQVSARLIAERQELHDRIEKLAAGGQTLEQEKQSAITAAERRVTQVEAELSRVTATLESARASAAEELGRVRSEAESALEEVRTRLAQAEGDREALRVELEREQLRGTAHQTSLGEIGEERSRLQATLEKLQTERRDLSARLDASGAEIGELQKTGTQAEKRIHALEEQLSASREELLAEAEKRLAGAAEGHRGELAELAERHAAELAAAERALEEARAEFESDLESVCRERDRLTEMLAEKELLLRSAEEGLTTFEVPETEDEADDSLLTIERSEAPQVERQADEEVEEIDEEPVTEAMLFEEAEVGASTARALSEYGHRVTAVTAEPQSVGHLQERFACAAINVSIPSAWSTLRNMRRRDASGPRVPLLAYALAANAPRGFWLGAVDFAILPAESCNLAEDLNRLVPRVRRVIAMSNDIDVMSDVRTKLTAAKISAAVVLDGRQALDLVSTVRPEAAVLHLSPSCVDVFRAIAGLRSSEITREIPILFLLDDEPQPREEAFLSAGIRMLSARGNLQPDELVDTLATALNPYCGLGEDESAAEPEVPQTRFSAARDS